MEAALMIDIGSTFTKACSVDLLDEKILATVCTPSTTNTNVSVGINKAIQLLDTVVEKKIDYKIRLATSSAAGGLRIAVVGLVPELTVKAGKISAYNAGAKIVGTYSYKLNKYEIIEIAKLNPDILLFVGGTDGGNEETLLWNANMIAQLEINAPIIFGGNKVIAVEVKAILEENGKNVFITENVLSQISKISTFAVKEVIRRIFIERIIISKGIGKARRYVDKDIIPTPLAVFNAIKLLSSGTDNVKGIGE
ncbi:MAG: MutL protein, partial [Desulfobacterales bacterium]|nr:MutL protein [Desulfobacterales bacterium]